MVCKQIDTSFVTKITLAESKGNASTDHRITIQGAVFAQHLTKTALLFNLKRWDLQRLYYGRISLLTRTPFVLRIFYSLLGIHTGVNAARVPFLGIFSFELRFSLEKQKFSLFSIAPVGKRFARRFCSCVLLIDCLWDIRDQQP